uniref:Uncharacterized protein n=1 Tax=Physcomitrium patens TaxID=3218 RepID=A0A7I3ZM35_PHYPA
MISLSKGLDNLTSLTRFNLFGCSSLTSLPNGLDNVISLTIFNLYKYLI